MHNLWPHCRGQTALHGAAREGHAAVVEKLISAKAKVDASGFQGHGLRVELYRGPCGEGAKVQLINLQILEFEAPLGR